MELLNRNQTRSAPGGPNINHKNFFIRALDFEEVSRLDTLESSQIGNFLVDPKSSGNIDEWALNICGSDILAFLIKLSDLIIGWVWIYLNYDCLLSPVVGTRRAVISKLNQMKVPVFARQLFPRHVGHLLAGMQELLQHVNKNII